MLLQPHQLSEQGKGQVVCTPKGQLHFFFAFVPHNAHLDHPRSFLANKLPTASDLRNLGDLTEHDSDSILRPFKRDLEPRLDGAVGQEGRLHAYDEVVDALLHGFELELVEVLEGGFFADAEDELRQVCESLVLEHYVHGDDPSRLQVVSHYDS